MENSAQRALGVVRALLSDYRFGGVASVVHVLDVPAAVCGRVEALALAGERLLDLDAEDFDLIAADRALPEEVVAPVRAAQFPRAPNDADRGSLRSLGPLYSLMLEAMDIRWRRREPVHAVVLLHLIAEYFPLLAWEGVLGHAGDPRELTRFVQIEDSRWGRRDPACGHNSAQRSAAQRIGTAMRGDADSWDAYLDRFHSRTADALARCASHPVEGRPPLEGVCRQPCTVWTQLPQDVRLDLGARVQLARMYAESPVVALRHHAPVGHFFGVPAPGEITQAWQRSWARLARPWRDGANPLKTAEDADGLDPPYAGTARGVEVLPGLRELVSAVAGRPIETGSVLRTIRDSILDALAFPPHAKEARTP
ncbi:hypothetical protein [Actinopolymorpha pittospori]|uniref:Uncharacterized protein n=1 Tax=Actinopolymorpha pittospori TaxID=648752 RepID=A0A927REN0_9ACTN|nr:hypothetical protein [Actinopolymorpha pittospori]MBE1612364.1 hypothetical protein [Actinopolymorpha pittospori]